MSFGDFDVMVQLIQCASCTAQIKVTSYFGMLLDSAIGPFLRHLLSSDLVCGVRSVGVFDVTALWPFTGFQEEIKFPQTRLIFLQSCALLVALVLHRTV